MNTELWERLVRRDAEAFKEIYMEYKNYLYRTCYFILLDQQRAEDALQEAFILAYNAIHQVRNPEAFKSWMIQICVRTSQKMARKIMPTTAIDDLITQITSDDYRTMPDKMMVSNENERLLYDALAKLKPTERAVVTLYYFNEISIKDISVQLAIPEGTIKWKLHQARNQLYKELTRKQADLHLKEEFR